MIQIPELPAIPLLAAAVIFCFVASSIVAGVAIATIATASAIFATAIFFVTTEDSFSMASVSSNLSDQKERSEATFSK